MTSEDVIRLARAESDISLLAFSGKDSLGCYIAIRDVFETLRIYHMYLIPGLEFVEESLDYYERIFGCHIERLPHPSLYRMLNNGVFQLPDRLPIIANQNLPSFSYDDLDRVMREQYDCMDAYCATGVRQNDSLQRRISIKTHGPINHKRKTYFPIFDWDKGRLLSEIKKSGIKLGQEYSFMRYSFDGIQARYLIPIKKERPRDYARILEWFPLAEMEVFRHERQQLR